ncbi:ABC transporter ATP-binding protein [Ensifer sp. ENS06]|uniref:ABC transporter ATP-binding protein n=1 Tax=Ensifer sp. ENS06 TaxID=2769276 RepID=UPI00177DC6E2|nr:ABC transporter ATP-binding protein [Ensifer sp. ENS06]MBD9627071.1 ABC transporter ATP-binding protein [Ensifer sp. ENS06]
MSLLELSEIDTFYDDMQALYRVDLTVAEGNVVAVIGPNGAGKTTLLKSISGWTKSQNGTISLAGQKLSGRSADEIVRLGVATVPEGRRLFASLTVEENLLMGCNSRRHGPWTLDRVYGLFPVLKERRHSPGTALSGGQQQMVAIGRALMTNPRILLCDELSLGLAPTVVNDIYAMMPRILDEGIGIVLVEQDVRRALSTASFVYCLMEGRVVLAHPPANLTMEQVSKAYFGVVS